MPWKSTKSEINLENYLYASVGVCDFYSNC